MTKQEIQAKIEAIQKEINAIYSDGLEEDWYEYLNSLYVRLGKLERELKK